VAIRRMTVSQEAKGKAVAKALKRASRVVITPGQLRAIVEELRPKPSA
jgi:hypothetical protein